MIARLLLAACVLVSLPLGGCSGRSDDREEILAVYNERDRCNNEGDGKGVLEVYAERSFAPYEKVVRAALEASKEELRQLSPTERVEVLLLRARGKREEV